ncbi:hypothetical protein NCCP1664_09810 [Zafaria cholistanensis]|uniref:Nicotinamide mononucleotide transporter n=1 Tax=Zafaria cholistanensis TaxID=1682741 RepID=A0A5A7NNI4_9MICC|nr:nicotinamide mononucleotide transporter [Zafaria cholistanensis]GER22484.1 hypothetical protein NCCP1664_09810 [Zafaria cholistanensis]
MDDLFYSLFGQAPGTDSGTQVALYAAGSLLTCIALLLLARRSDLAWWAQILAVFAGPLTIALLYGYEGLISAVPKMAAAAYGLWRFSKYPLVDKFGREVEVRGFSLRSLAWGLALTAAFTALALGPMLTTGFIFSDLTTNLWLSLLLESVVVVALVGLAHGVRWAWLAVAASGAAYIAVLFGGSPALATLGLLVFQILAALYGWWAWRPVPSGTVPDEAETYPPNPYRD